MSAITTHVLDTARGLPAAGMAVVLERRAGQGEWYGVGRGETDAEGRLRSLMPDGAAIVPGFYRMIFDTRRYFNAIGVRGFYPQVVVIFETVAGETHYHVPLLLGPFGYTTYRGS
jgi:5-hydroxyisourate hydrolase